MLVDETREHLALVTGRSSSYPIQQDPITGGGGATKILNVSISVASEVALCLIMKAIMK